MTLLNSLYLLWNYSGLCLHSFLCLKFDSPMLGTGFFKRVLLFVLLPLALSCNNEQPIAQRVLLVEVGDSRLYEDEVGLLLAANNISPDSTRQVDELLERWAMEELYYDVALHNVASTEEIENMVERYRRSLILNMYQERLIDQRLKSAVSEKESQLFYDSNKMLFDADENLIKGFLLVLPAKAPNANKVRRWCSNKTSEDFEELEKYCAEHAVAYEYFMDTWCAFEDVAVRTPLTETQLLDRLSRGGTIEFKEDGKLYFVCADSIIRKGDTLPVELVKADIDELIVNSRKAEFIKNRKQELYDDAKRKGVVKFYNK